MKYYVLNFSLLLLTLCIYADKPKVIATINGGINPAGIAITPNNKYAYVANNNNYGIENGDSVSVLNLENNTLKTTIHHPSFNEPYTVTINQAGTRAYVTNSNSTTITIIDIKTNNVIGIIGGFDGPSGMVITPNGTQAYVNNYGGPEGVGSGNGTTLRIVNLNTNTIVGAPIMVGLAPAALAISPNGKQVYVANYGNGTMGNGSVAIIDTNTNMLVQTIPGFFGPFAIAITPNGKYAYVTNFGSNNFEPIGTTVSIIDLKTNNIKKIINLGIQPSGIAINPRDHFAYVTNYNTLYAGENFTNLTAGQGTVNIIDTNKNIVIPPTLAVGQSPANIAVSSNGKYAYVTNYTSNIVNVIALN